MLTYHHSPVRTVPYHQQDTVQWCGSACALMVLHSLGIAKLDGTNLDQNRLRAVVKNSARSDPTYLWSSAPDGLAYALNYFCTRAAAKTGKKATSWSLIVEKTEEQISRQIAWHLWHYELPVIALVFGMQHWVVISGCVISQPPTGPDDEEYEIVGFHLRDPWPPLPTKLAHNDGFRHLDPNKAGDIAEEDALSDGCGDGWNGDLESDEVGGRGVALRFVSYEDWRMRDTSTPSRKRHTGYMTGVPATVRLPNKVDAPEMPVRSKWVGRFLAICDPDEGTAGDAEERRHATSHINKASKARRSEKQDKQAPTRSSTRKTHNGTLYELSEAEVIEIASEILGSEYRHILESHKANSDRKQDTDRASITHEQARLVEWLDTAGEYHEQSAYYIVPFTVNKTQHIAVQVGARTHSDVSRGRTQVRDNMQLALRLGVSASWLNVKPKGDAGQASTIIKENTARGLIAGRSFRTPGGGRVVVPVDYSGVATLVWKPCRESFDPLCPFYEFKVPSLHPDSAPSYIYVRSTDGTAFPYLTEYGGGI